MADEGEFDEINTLNAEIADMKSTLADIQKTDTTVDSGMDAIATYIARKGDADGFVERDGAPENPFHAVIKGQRADGGGASGGAAGEEDCCSIL